MLLSPVTEPALSEVDATAVQDVAARRTVLVASLVGTTVEWYDFFLYATAATIVFNHAFFPSQSSTLGTVLAFATFAVGFVMRPIGGFVFGHIGDRIGRKRSLALTMLLMGGATALMGALPTAAQVGALAPVLLVTLRIIQGFALGGEWAGAMLLAVEHSPDDRRGSYGSAPQVGLALGLALGTGVFAMLQLLLPAHAFASYGWRIAFLFSIVLVFFGLMVRLRVAETPAFRAMDARAEHSAVPAREVFTPPALRSNLLGLLSRWAEGAAFNTWGVFAIAYSNVDFYTMSAHLGDAGRCRAVGYARHAEMRALSRESRRARDLTACQVRGSLNHALQWRSSVTGHGRDRVLRTE